MRPAAVLLAVAITAAPLAAGAQTLDLPPRKAGLWEITTTIDKQKASAETPEKARSSPSLAAQMCLDASTDRDLMSYGLKLSDGRCTKLTTKRDGKSIIIEADCSFAGKTSKTKTVITGDLQSAYTMRTEGTLEGGSKGPQTMLTTQIATWKSAQCPGMKPGDISLFGGVKMNINQLKALSGLIR
jgi:hypothetical protein